MDLNNALVYKANANHSHSEYVEKNNLPFIPTKVSQLTNDAGYITEIPDEYITEIPAEYITETELLAKNYANKDYVTSAINNAQLGGGGDNPSIDLSVYALKDDLADYVTKVALDGEDYANKAYVDNAIKNADMSDVDLSNYATKADLNNKADSTHAHEEYALKTEVPTDCVTSNSIIRIELVTEYPETEEDGVLYIKVSE
jgi:hypothetical protein